MTYFNDFISNISLTDEEKARLQKAHTELQTFLASEKSIEDVYVTTFLQGSYRRSTALKAVNGESSDVDVVLVTTVDYKNTKPSDFLKRFYVSVNKHYPSKCKLQGRSIGIEIDNVSMDLVPVAVINPSKALPGAFIKIYRDNESLEDLLSSNRLLETNNNAYNPSSPLMLADQKTEKWEETHPLAQLKWTHEKNKRCNGFYLPVVKAIKWWHKVKYPEQEHPNSYPLEHFIGDCCPDGIDSVAEGVVRTLENMTWYTQKPFLPDRGVPKHNVFGKVTDEEYHAFYCAVCDAAKLARQALDSVDIAESVNLWVKLFGTEFPTPSKNTVSFTKRTEPTKAVPRGNFA